MREIHIKNACKPAGHYSPAIESGGILYVSGQLPIDPFTGEKCHGSAAEQTERALKNMDLILTSAGSARDKVTKVSIYVSDIDFWEDIDTVYSRFFGVHKPARIVIPTGKLHYGFMVEIAAEAEL